MLSMAALSAARCLQVITPAYTLENVVLAAQSKGPRDHTLKGVAVRVCGQGVNPKRLP